MRLWEQFLTVDASDPEKVAQYCRKEWFVVLDPKEPSGFAYHEPDVREFAEWQTKLGRLVEAGHAYQERVQTLAQTKGRSGWKKVEAETLASAINVAGQLEDFIRHLSPVIRINLVDGMPVFQESMGIADVTGETQVVWPGISLNLSSELPIKTRLAKNAITIGHVCWDLFKTLKESLPVRQCGNSACGRWFVATKRQAVKARVYCETCRTPDSETSEITPARRTYMREKMREYRLKQGALRRRKKGRLPAKE